MFDPFTSTQPEPHGAQFDPFKAGELEKTLETPPVAKEFQKSMYPDVSSLAKETIDSMVDNEFTYDLDREAEALAGQVQQDELRVTLEEAAAEQTDTVTLLKSLQEKSQESPLFSTFIDSATVAVFATSDNRHARELAKRELSRSLILVNELDRRLSKEEDRPWWRDFNLWGEFADVALTASVPFASSAKTKARVKIAQDIMNLQLADITDEEYHTQISTLLDQAADQGFFTDDSRLFFGDLLSILPERGKGAEARKQALWGTVDTLLALPVATAAKVGSRAFRVGSDLLTARSVAKVSLDEAVESAIANDVVHGAAAIAQNATPAAGRTSFDLLEYRSAPTAKALRDVEDSSQAFKDLQGINFGEAIDDANFAAAKAEYMAEVNAANMASGRNALIDWNFVDDSTGNLFAQRMFGTKTGRYFISEANAKTFAKEIGGEVREVPDVPGSYVVLKSDNVPRGPEGVKGAALWLTTEVDELGLGFWARYGSPLVQTTERLNAILKQGEAAASLVKSKVFKEHSKLLRGASKKETRAVDELMESYRDQPSMSRRRSAPTPAQVRTDFYAVHGRNPTAKEQALSESFVETHDIIYFSEADPHFKTAVDAGHVIASIGGKERRVVRAKELPAGSKVFDIANDALLDEVPAGYTLLRVADDGGYKTGAGRAAYVAVKNPKTRRLYHTDVLEYNFGGHRVYFPNSVKFHVKQDRVYKTVDGSMVKADPKTIMGVKTRAEALLAETQINTVLRAIKDRLPHAATFDDARALATDRVLQQIVRDNSSWNINAETLENFLDFMETNKIDIRKKVDFTPSGAAVASEGDAFFDDILKAQTHEAAFIARTGGRKDAPLMGFGGAANRTLKPIEVQERGLASIVANRSEAAYGEASIYGLLRAVLSPSPSNPSGKRVLVGISDRDFLAQTRAMTARQKLDFLKDKIETKSIEGRKLALERDKIEFRLNRTNWFTKAWRSQMEVLGDHLYGAGWKKTADIADKWSSDPVTAFRGFAFDAKLGLFAFDQVFVQASQLVNVYGMSSLWSPAAVAATPAVRFALLNGKPQVISQIGKRLGPIMGLTEDQFIDMVKSLRESGRALVDSSVAELGADAAAASTIGRLHGIRKGGRFFFNEGELAARIGGWNTAYVEYVKKFGTAPTSQAGRRWVMHRQDILTNAMTHASRSPYQAFPGFQFLTYTWRMSEAMFAGSLKPLIGGEAKAVLTGAQKAKLMTTFAVMYGFAGLPGANFAADRIEHTMGVDMDPNFVIDLRGGMADTLSSWALGTETNISKRLAWGEGLFDLIKDFGNKDYLEAVGGPAGELAVKGTGDAITAVTSLALSIAGQYPEDLAKADWSKLVQHLTIGNRVVDAYTIWSTGEYLTKNGVKVVDDLGWRDALATFVGVPLEEVNAAWGIVEQKKFEKDLLRRRARKVSELYGLYYKAIERKDESAQLELRKAIHVHYVTLTPKQQREMGRMVNKGTLSMLENLVLQEFQSETAQRYR